MISRCANPLIPLVLIELWCFARCCDAFVTKHLGIAPVIRRATTHCSASRILNSSAANDEFPLRNDLMIRAARGEAVERTPVWLFRQAGRWVLSSYRTFVSPACGAKHAMTTAHEFLVVVAPLSVMMRHCSPVFPQCAFVDTQSTVCGSLASI